MKRLVKSMCALVLAVLAGTYAFGLWSLSATHANRFLDELETLSLQGHSAEYCARLHVDLQVSIRDHSAQPAADFDGGRDQFCAYVSYAARGVDLLGISTQVSRNEFTITRSALHPWTAHVSYHEVRTTTMSKVQATLHTVSDDSLTLVQTFDGVKVLALRSRVEPAP
jgi:hypothetical protein